MIGPRKIPNLTKKDSLTFHVRYQDIGNIEGLVRFLPCRGMRLV